MEEEINELRAKVIASMPSSANPSSAPKRNYSNSKEEGELSSGNDAGMPCCSTAQPNSSNLLENFQGNTLNNQPRRIKSVKTPLGSSSSMVNVQPRTSVSRNYIKRLKTNQVTFQSSIPQSLSWHGRGSDDNLVISFSDDDSRSNSEEIIPNKGVNRKSTARAVKSEVPISSKQAHSGGLQGLVNRAKPVRKKRTVNPASISSRGASFRHSIASPEMDTLVLKQSSVIKMSGRQERGLVRDADKVDQTVESLRHEIALRENKLKFQSKSTPQSNVRTAVSYSENRGPPENMVSSISSPVYVTAGLATKVAVNRPDSVTAVRGPQFVTTVGLAANEQVTKHPKLDEHLNSKSSSDGQLQLQIPSDVSALEFGRQPMESSNFCRDRDLMKCHKDVSDAGTYPPVSCVVSVKNAKDNSLVPACEPICSLGNFEIPSSEHENCMMLVADVSCSSDKFGKRDMAVDPPANLHQGSFFTQMAPDMHAEALRESDKSSSTILRAESVKQSSISKKIDDSNPSPKRAADEHNMERSQQIITGRNVTVPMEISKRIPDENSIEITGRKLGHHEAYLQNRSLLNYSSQIKFSGEAVMNLQSLIDLEELKDKELEDAQEFRCRCELEERHALKEYRKAQRALVEANERCSQLYGKRELFSAQLRTLLMDTSSSIWSSNWQSQKGTVSQPLKTVPEFNFNLLSSLGNQLPAGQILDHLAYESNTGCPVDAPHNSREPMDGQEFCSGQCSEQDATTSDHRANSVLDGVCTPTHHPNVSIDNQDNFLFDNKSVESRLACDIGDENCGQRSVDVNAESERLSSDGNEQDYELLEASLRSKLVARLGKRMPSKTNKFSNTECKNNSASGQQIQDKDETQISAAERHEGTTDQLTAELHNQCHGNSFSLSDEVYGNRVVEDNSSFPRESCWPPQTTAFPLPSSVLHVVSGHMKSILPDSCNELSNELPTTEENDNTVRTSPKKNTNCVPDDGGSISCNNIRSAETGNIELHDCDLTIDPFWPFCTFELRGKCNDDECHFQHLKRRTRRKLKHNEHSANSCSVPAYYIGSSLIKVNSFLSWSILARSAWHYWQRGFCASFPLPFSIRRDLPADAPFLQNSPGPIADDYNWNRLSLYYQTLDCTMKQFAQGLPETEQSLEMALYLFYMNVNRQHREKVLSLLSRAIEVDHTSAVLWVAYLHIYYGQEKGIGKDDMFSHAVQHNGDSYELWLLYINSRMHLSDRLKAYEYALTTFCNKENAFTKEKRYISSCILDIFLQMTDCLCMSGDVEKAIQKIYELLETSGDKLLLKIHSCLIVSDRCIFWVCCIYLAIYRKLPKVIIEQFEFEKDLPFVLEWPSVQLTTQRKDCALGLMKLAVDNTNLDVDVNPHKKDPTALRSLHFLAVSHIRLVAALEGLHHSADLLANYLKLYPTCIELVLVAARFHEKCDGDVMFRGFEELLSSWPKEIPGAQCLWNQYAEHALADKRIDFAENLMIRWFQCFCEGKDAHDRKLEGTEGRQKNDTFGFLNLSLKRMLQKNFREARLAIDKALKLASPEDYKHCVREHAAFTFSNGLGLDGQTNVSFGAVLGLLNFYMADSRTTSIIEPLSRNFYQNIKKPRVRHFMDKILGPVSRDFTLMNSVLEACYGPSLLPERFDDVKDFVDFVESLMGIAPANFKLALSVYRIAATVPHRADVAACAIKFWASTLLINSIFQAIPVAPEHVWLEVAHLMRDSGSPDISQRFHQQAISVYPFSIKLWQSFLIVSKNAGNVDTILTSARERGLELSQVPDKRFGLL